MSSRTEENTFVTPPSGDFPIPLPPPGGFDDIACLDTNAPAPEQGPFPDPDLGTLFSSESEAQEDVRGETVCCQNCNVAVGLLSVEVHTIPMQSTSLLSNLCFYLQSSDKSVVSAERHRFDPCLGDRSLLN
jgi:hypothetical protein